MVMRHTGKLHHDEKAFTFVEMLIVVAILAVLVVVGAVNTGKHISQGRTEAYATELQEIQTAVGSMLHESNSSKLSPVVVPTNDMSSVHTTGPKPLVLSDYLSKLDSSGRVVSGCTYTFTEEGVVSQITPY